MSKGIDTMVIINLSMVTANLDSMTGKDIPLEEKMAPAIKAAAGICQKKEETVRNNPQWQVILSSCPPSLWEQELK